MTPTQKAEEIAYKIWYGWPTMGHPPRQKEFLMPILLDALRAAEDEGLDKAKKAIIKNMRNGTDEKGERIEYNCGWNGASMEHVRNISALKSKGGV